MFEFCKGFDEGFLLFLQDVVRNPILDKIMLFITSLGNAGIIWILLAIALLFTKKYKKTGWTMGLALVLGLIITNLLLKNTVARIRPYEVVDGLTLLLSKKATDFSFPSGHSTSSIAASLVMLKTMPKKYGIPAFVLAIFICFSRLYVGVHYPTDVICGIIIGIVCAVLAMFMVRKLVEAQQRKMLNK